LGIYDETNELFDFNVQENQNATGSYANYTSTWLINPWSGNPWTYQEVDALQIGLYMEDDTNLTQIYVTVNYSYGSTVNNYDLVKEAWQDENNSYLYQQNDIVSEDTFNCNNHTSETGTINWVKVIARAMKTSTASDEDYFKIICDNGTKAYSDDKHAELLTNNYKNIEELWTTRPSDSGAWEWSDIDNLKIGVQALCE